SRARNTPAPRRERGAAPPRHAPAPGGGAGPPPAPPPRPNPPPVVGDPCPLDHLGGWLPQHVPITAAQQAGARRGLVVRHTPQHRSSTARLQRSLITDFRRPNHHNPDAILAKSVT